MTKDSNSEEPTLRIPKSSHPVPTNPKLKNRRIPVILYAALSIALILGLVVGAKSLGWYGTSGKVDAATGQAITLGPTSVGEDIKGWMTIEQVLDGFSLKKESFYSKFSIPSSISTNTTVGSLSEEVLSFELPAFREWINTKLAESGPSIALSTPTASALDRATTPAEHPLDPSTTPKASARPESTSSSADFVVKGRTTIQEVLDATKISRTEFYKRFAIPDRIPTSIPLSGIQGEGVNDFEVSAVRDWFDSLA